MERGEKFKGQTERGGFYGIIWGKSSRDSNAAATVRASCRMRSVLGERDTMVSKKVKITCEYGLHMLPSVMISDRLSKFYECKIWINWGQDINAKNVVDLMCLPEKGLGSDLVL